MSEHQSGVWPNDITKSADQYLKNSLFYLDMLYCYTYEACEGVCHTGLLYKL